MHHEASGDVAWAQENPQCAEATPQSEAPSAAAAASTAPDSGPEQRNWQALIEELERKVAEHYDAWLRAKAEAENIRKRSEDEIAKARRYALDRFAAALLPVKDSLEAALATENQSVESLREGVTLTLRQLAAALEQHGVVEEDPLGSRFDPNRHQAIGMIESDEEPNIVAQVLQKGYLLHDRVLRPALVMVTKARSTPESSA